MNFGFMFERGATDAVFVLRRLPEGYRAEGRKLCIVDLENAFDRVPWKVMDCAVSRNGIPEV